MTDLKQFIAERNEALLSLDKSKIERFAKKYDIHLPTDDEVFWRGVHKAICNIPSIPFGVRQKLMKIMTYGYNPAAGYTDWDWVNGVFQPVGNHIQYPRSSNRQVYWKNQSNRKVRRYKGSIPKGNSYRKHFEYVYTIF